MAIAPSRLAAYDALRRIEAGGVAMPQALASARARLGDDRDRALVVELVTGTERWRGALDFLIQRYAGRPLSRLDAEVVTVLRLAGHQLLHLDRVPAAAVIDDAVELTRRAGKTSAAGFVNAVLRAFARDRAQPPLPQPPVAARDADARGQRQAELDYLSITLSHPRWLVERWLDRHGFEAARSWASFDNAAAPLTLRVNRLKISRHALVSELEAHGITVEPARFAPDGLTVTAGNPLQTPLAGSGLFFVQDEASQLVAAVAGATPGALVLDCCAAPGGKTTAMAADMENTGMLVAADVRGRRVSLLRQAVMEGGAACVRVIQADLRQAAPCRPVFGLVLVDAPCSGLGILRSDPDVRWRRDAADIAGFAAAQRQLLDVASETVRPGGRLVYATCSSEPEENERVFEAFLADHEAFKPVDLRTRPPKWTGLTPALFTTEGYLRTSPFAHGLEAFFAAAATRAPA